MIKTTYPASSKETGVPLSSLPTGLDGKDETSRTTNIESRALRTDDVLVMEFLAFWTDRPLEEVCGAIQTRLDLPPFVFDQDERSRWGASYRDGVKYCASIPHELPSYPEWPAFPDDACNASFVLLVGELCPHGDNPEWASNVLVPQVAQAVAEATGGAVVHHKTWLLNDVNRAWSRVFFPAESMESLKPPPIDWGGVRPRTPRPAEEVPPGWAPFLRVTTNPLCRPAYNGPLDFAFVVHPRVFEENVRAFPEGRRLPRHLIAQMSHMKQCFVISWLQVRLGDRMLHGELLTIPFTPMDMLERLPEAREAIQAVQTYASSRRTGVLGLGALIPSITRQGMLLARRQGTVGLTTGHCFTALSIAEYVRKIEAVRGRERPVAVIGAAGSTGRAATRCLLRDQSDRQLLLYDLPQRLGNIPRGPWWNPKLHSATADRADLRKAGIVVCVTNAPGSILSANDFAPDCVVLDDAQPENVSYEALRERPDLAVVKCLARVPGLQCPFDFGLFSAGAHQLNQELTFTCLAETILLAASDHLGSFTVGDPRDDQLDFIEAAANRYNIGVAPFQSFPQIGTIDLERPRDRSREA